MCKADAGALDRLGWIAGSPGLGLWGGATIACNRAFVRAVRNFLNVHIVGDDEIDKSEPGKQTITNQGNAATGSLSPNQMLQNIASKDLDCATFGEFKDYLRNLWVEKKYRNDSIKEWESFSDIPAKEARILLKLVKSS